MHILTKYLFLIPFSLFLACSGPAKRSESSGASSDTKADLAVANDAWIAQRVEEAKARLNTSPAGQKLLESIAAHGGLSTWFSNGPVQFHFDYQPLDGGKRRDSYQMVDQWSVRAVHEVASNRSWKYGWDGSNAWSFPDSVDVGVNPRFWSTTPFYFIGLPFVLADEGVLLEPFGQKEFKGTTYDLVKASYEQGVGDAPDDYYVIYIHPETKLMGGLRYIVSYPGFFPDGGHAPEKFMEIVELRTVENVVIPTGYNTYWFKDDEPAEHITKIDVSEVSFVKETKNSAFDMPNGARIQENL